MPDSPSVTPPAQPAAARRVGTVLLAAAIVAGLVPRVLLILQGKLNSDESIVGLMGMEILKGHHFVFYMGQGYMGTIEPYTAALLFALFGASPAALKLSPFLFFLAAAWFHARLAARLFDGATARLTLVFLFCSSWVFTVWSFAPRGGYMTALALGGAALLVGARIDQQGGGAREYLLLGLLCGLGLWTHFFFVYYLVPLGLLVVLPALRFPGRLPRLASLAAGAVGGALPLIAWNLRHEMGSFRLKKGFTRPEVWSNLSNLFERQLPYLLGGDALDGDGMIWKPVTWLVLAVWAAAAAWYLHRAGQRWRGAAPGRCAFLLVPGVVVTAVFLFAESRFGDANTQRYLLPVYPVAAVALAAFAADLWRRRAALGAALVLFLVAVNLWGAGHFALAKGIPQGRAQKRDAGDILSFCRKEGVTTAWAGYWDSYLLTFLSRQEVVVADYDRVRYEPFRRLVADSPDPALIGSVDPAVLGGTLTAAGLRFTPCQAGPWTVFAHIRPDPSLGPLDRQVAARLGGTAGGEFEALPGGGVRTVRPQAAGDRVVLDLGGRRQVNGVVLEPGAVPREHIREFVVETSPDGAAWERAITVDSFVDGIRWDGRIRWDQSGIVETHFPPRPAAFIRVTSSGSSRDRRWRLERAWATVVDGG